MDVDSLADAITSRSRLVLVLLLLATLVVGAGAANVGQSSSLDQFQTDSTEAEKQAYIDEHFSTGPDNRTTVQVVVRGENVLSKESLLATLRFQQALRDDEEINATLAPENPSMGVSNLVAMAAMRQQAAMAGGGDGSSPPAALASLSDQIDTLESMDDAEVEAVVEQVLAAEGATDAAFTFMPRDYEPGSTTAETRMLVVFQSTEGEVGGISSASDRLVDSQLQIGTMADEQLGEESFVFGLGVVTDEIGRSMGDSFLIITPLMILFVLVTLTVAYRDILDIILGMVGVALVLVWMAGFMGWLGIAFNQMMIAVPMLLIGLSIDYAIHVFMRYREEREGTGESVRTSMALALSGVGMALLWVTTTTAFGFLSNLSSSVPPIQDFGLVSAAGIVGTLIVFGGLIPALKVELDSALEGHGFDRHKRAFGTRGGWFTRLLSVGTVAATRAPVALLVVAVLISAGGAWTATGVDTNFSEEDFIAEDPPAWMERLPGPFAPGEYTVRENVEYVDAHFVQLRDTTRAQILVEGDVTADDTLERLADARNRAAESSTTVILSNGEAKIDGPLATMEAATARNDEFATVFEAADTDGNGVPDQNLQQVYDALYTASPEEAATVLHRTDDGDYEAARLVISVSGSADVDTVTADTRTAAELVDGDGLTATATGQPILTAVVQGALLDTMTSTLILTLTAVGAFLLIAYRLREGSASLGAVTIIPVLMALSWTMGSMYLLEIPFNAETAMITGIAIGLGVDYAIHVGERFTFELGRGSSVEEALHATTAGTGGALLGSAVTTASGFGVLAFALVPSLQRFGLVTGLTIVYAFVSTVVIMPSLLVLWERSVGIDGE